jgi:hypothetical protein
LTLLFTFKKNKFKFHSGNFSPIPTQQQQQQQEEEPNHASKPQEQVPPIVAISSH